MGGDWVTVHGYAGLAISSVPPQHQVRETSMPQSGREMAGLDYQKQYGALWTDLNVCGEIWS
jgi:hypothetical protein